MTARKPKPVVATWAWVNADGWPVTETVYLSRDGAQRHAPFMHLSNGHRLVKMVPHDPRAARVLRAAAKWAGYSPLNRRYDTEDAEELRLAAAAWRRGGGK